MKYVNYINKKLFSVIKKESSCVVFGQNITLGSALSGLGKNLFFSNKKIKVINTQNSENSLVGMGLGLMITKVNSVFLVKQQDFLLLSLDQLVSTVNALRDRKIQAYFNIFSIVVDIGYEGPQSCLNNSSDFFSLTKIPTYHLNSKEEIDIFFKYHFRRKGIKLVNISQRLFKKELIVFSKIKLNKSKAFVQNSKGKDVTAISFNFAFEEMKNICAKLTSNGFSSSIFSILEFNIKNNYFEIFNEIRKTKKLLVFDDSKSVNKFSEIFIKNVLTKLPKTKVFYYSRNFKSIKSKPNNDIFKIPYNDIKNLLVNLKVNK